MAQVCLCLVLVGITAYAVLGGADFGGGFWDLTAGGAEGGGRVRGMVQRSMSPVWEANHVWLIFCLVIAWTAFPVAFGSVFSTLRVPLFLAAIGTALAALALWFVGTFLRFRRLPRSSWFYRAVVAAGPVALVALIAGWITTEVGRQPWIAYQVMRTAQAVTGADGLAAGYVFLVCVYVALGAAVVWLLRRLSRRPATEEVAR